MLIYNQIILLNEGDFMIFTHMLGIELTQQCNLDCSDCYKGNSRNVFITKTIIEKIFDEVKVADILVLTGGEIHLAYEQLKMVLKIAKEKNCYFSSGQITINGTIFDERIYHLLDEYFGENYKYYVSSDSFHDGSIKRIYQKDAEDSNNPLHPKSLNDVWKNLERNYMHEKCAGEQGLPSHLINGGRARNLDCPKYDFETTGYYYQELKDDCYAVGPILFIGAEGYITDGNSELNKREEQSIGHLNKGKIMDQIKRGGIAVKTQSITDFRKLCGDIMKNYFSYGDPHYIFENNKMKKVERQRDFAYIHEAEKAIELWNQSFKAFENGSFKDFLANFSYDFSSYPKDLTLMDHNKKLGKQLNAQVLE